MIEMSTKQQSDNGRSDFELTAADVLSTHTRTKSGACGIERRVSTLPIGCPRCGRELEHGPYGTYVCWRCPERVASEEEMHE